MEGILNSPRGHALASRTAWEGLWSAQTAELTIRRDPAVEMHHAIECGPTCDPVIFVSLDSLAIDNSLPKGIKIGRISSPVLIPIFCASFIITYRHYDDLSIQNSHQKVAVCGCLRSAARPCLWHIGDRLHAIGVGDPEWRASALCGTRRNHSYSTRNRFALALQVLGKAV